MKPFDNVTLSQRVRDHLRDQILANALAPGTPLHEEEIAAQLGISRAPVREALRLLAAEDLVTIAPRRGAIVKALSPQEFLDAYQVREALEVLAIRLAIPRLADADLQGLRDLHGEMMLAAARADVEGFFEANTAFHTALVEASGNARLAELYRLLMNQLRRYRMRSMSLRGGLERSIAEHAAILEAVTRRDSETASRLLGEHIRMPQRILEAAPDGELQTPGGRPATSGGR
ncbi:MAG: GntR family transcriptional regulator [Armatimonadota bacterium]|nr:GntR family transcriptional regulator [Armatimonadota bacterium]MDR7495476.1 GntR family transcriptional regulator [Armatimonadota bacterium]MDR7510433.1 GntR family transcriptional regulator [Armatimonadota bacterium]